MTSSYSSSDSDGDASSSLTTPTEMIFEYVCPALGMILANVMFAAPFQDLQTAVSVGLGLGDLNPTPFAFMLGNCIGWTTYGVITNNWFIFWANYPGFLIACWLNLGAVKLLYSHHHQKVARTSIVHFLNNNNNNNDVSSSSSSFRSRSAQSISSRSMNNDSNTDTVNNDNDDNESDKVNNDNDDNENGNDNDKIESSSIDYDYDENPTDTPTTQLSHTTTAQQNQDPDPDPTDNKDWTQIIWDVTSQTKPARTPHERLVMGIILVWTIVLSLIGFLGHYKKDSEETTTNNNGESDTTSTTSTMDVAQLIVGYVVNFNLVFFYGAPLSAITQVLNTKRNNTLHVPTMITNTSCALFWTAYAVAPHINDPFIYVPNGLGVILGIIQFVLWTIFPSITTTTTTTTSINNQKQEQEHESDDT